MNGKATLSPMDGLEPITFSKGYQVIFHKGFACNWHMTEPMKKHYTTNEGQPILLFLYIGDYLMYFCVDKLGSTLSLVSLVVVIVVVALLINLFPLFDHF